MAQQTIEFDGQSYIPSKQAAKATGYAQDYIGQLARSGAVAARRVGGLWYVNMDSLTGHKKDAEAYVPELPLAPDIENSGSIVTFDGKEYIASKRAAAMTSYAQDYVGQLARSGKIKSRQMGGRWYVSKDDLMAHKREKDAMLAAVQAESVGIERHAAKSGPEIESGPLLSYHSEPNLGLPSLIQKAPIPSSYTVSRNDISDYSRHTDLLNEPAPQTEEIESGGENAIHHIAIRSMRRDSDRAIGPSQHELAAQRQSSGRSEYRKQWNTPKAPRKRQGHLRAISLIFIVVLAFSGIGYYFYAQNGSMHSIFAVSDVDSAMNGNNVDNNSYIGLFLDEVTRLMGGEISYQNEK